MPKKDTKRAPEDVVRVLRVIEYVGPRSWVEATMAHAIKGTLAVAEGKRICAVTIGDYPEILIKAGSFVPDRPNIGYAHIDAPKVHPADAPPPPTPIEAHIARSKAEQAA